MIAGFEEFLARVLNGGDDHDSRTAPGQQQSVQCLLCLSLYLFLLGAGCSIQLERFVNEDDDERGLHGPSDFRLVY